MHALRGRTADEVWRTAAALFREGGPASVHEGRGGNTEELLHVILEIAEPRDRWVVSRTPAISPAFALVEVFWILAGRQDIALPAYWNSRLPQYCGNAPMLNGAYGYRMRRHFGVDQLERIYRLLDSQADSRQAVLQIWDAEVDLPEENGAPRREDIPCNVMAMLKVRKGRLDWLQILRSNDVFRGLPYNIVQFTTIQEMMAGWLGVEVGSYTHVTDSLHVYESDLIAVRSSLIPLALPINADTFALPRHEWDGVLSDVIRRLEIMTAPSTTATSLRAIAFAGDTPAAYEQAVRIAAADAARRRGWGDLATECAANCGSEALRYLWERWSTRLSVKPSFGDDLGALDAVTRDALCR